MVVVERPPFVEGVRRIARWAPDQPRVVARLVERQKFTRLNAHGFHLADRKHFFGYAQQRPMIKIKGKELRFELGGTKPNQEHKPSERLFTDSKILRLPPTYGIIHDPEGTSLPRCLVFFGPYRSTANPVKLDRTARKYFGSSYQPVAASVDIDVHGNWIPVNPSLVVQIWYLRRGDVGVKGPHQGRFFHPFKSVTPPLVLSKCGRNYCLEMPNGCIINDRGFVFP